MLDWSWKTGLTTYFQYLVPTIEDTLLQFDKQSKRNREFKEMTNTQMIREIKKGKFEHGDIVHVIGLFSEFIPILNTHFLFPKTIPLRGKDEYSPYLQIASSKVSEFSLPLRLKPIQGLGVAGLYNTNSKGVYDPCIPLFYKDNRVVLKRKLTGKIVEVQARVIELPAKWARFFMPHDGFGYKSDIGSTKYYGLLIEDVKERSKAKSFFVDTWRMDYFPLIDFEKSRYEFYHYEKDFNGWPNAFRSIHNMLGFLQLEGYRIKQFTFFGILPRINILNSDKLKQERTNLRNFYQYGYKQSDLSKNEWKSTSSIGHGEFDSRLYKKVKTVFQFDQVNPIVKQEFDFKF